MEHILSLLSTNKAIAFDAVSDLLFKGSPEQQEGRPSNLRRAAQKLRNIWRLELDQMREMEDTWAARLIPLNKSDSQTPSRKQFRPILVQSPLVKLLEARFLPKLQEYLNLR